MFLYKVLKETKDNILGKKEQNLSPFPHIWILRQNHSPFEAEMSTVKWALCVCSAYKMNALRTKN